MSSDLHDPTAEPLPNPLLGFLGRLMADTLKRGGHAASAWTESDPSGGRVSSFTQGDAAAMVEVTYAESAMADDVVRLDEVWRLFEAGAPVLRLGSPVKPLPWSFVGAAMVTVSGIRHEVVVIDRRGNVAALESRRRIVGKKYDKVVRDQKLGKVVRDQVMRYAQPEGRNRAKRASAKLNEVARLAGLAPPSSVLFTSGAAGHILADPERRGIDVGLPAIQWSYKTVDRHGTERIVASSDQGDTAPLSQLATACVAALVVDEFGATKPGYGKSNAQNVEVGGVVDDWLRPTRTPGVVHRATPETGKPVASEVVISKTAPLEKAELNGICASCGKTALLGAGDLCRPCWSADNAAMRRSLEGSPSAVYDLVHRAPEPDELKPHPTDGREWTDPTGTLGEAFADNSLPLEMAMATVSLVPEDLIARWRAAGLNHREVAVMFANEAGLSQREIGDQINRSHQVVGDILKAARKKLEK